MNKRDITLLTASAVALGLAARVAIRRARAYDLTDKVVLITGGSRGLGLLLAREFAKEGARVALCARDADELVRAQAKLAGEGIDAFIVPGDVTDQARVDATVQAMLTQFGRIDVLVNNAGVIEVSPLEEMTLEDYQESIQTHFWGPLYLTLAVLPEMRQRKEGRIVNISSIGGKIPVPHLVPYSAGKFALAGLSGGMRAELAHDNVIVTTIYPGLMRTGSPPHAIFKGQNKKEYAWFSIGDSLPGASMSADRAARQIVAACKFGDAERVLSLPAYLAVKAYALFPNAGAPLLSLMNKILPAPGGIGQNRATGAESQSPLSPSPLTALGDKASRDNNELTELTEYLSS